MKNMLFEHENYEINGTLWKIKHIMQHTLKTEQQNAKNNAELYTKWMKMAWKTYEENIRPGQNRSIKASLVLDDDNNDALKMH